MHNCYYYMILTILIIKIYAQVAFSYRIDQTLYLIDEQLITSCITKISLVNYYSEGIEAIELDSSLVKEKVNNTLDSNLPSIINYEIKYYFYDYRTLQSYEKNVNKCNSVQILITFEYLNDKIDKTLRYQLVNEL